MIHCYSIIEFLRNSSMGLVFNAVVGTKTFLFFIYSKKYTNFGQCKMGKFPLIWLGDIP